MYYLVFGSLYLLALLPFGVLYLLSNITARILHDVVRYRRAVVEENLRLSFPEKTAAELDQITRRFYRAFCDNWLETIRLMSMRKAAFRKRVSGNFELFENLAASGKPVCMATAHFFNWEFLNAALCLFQPIPVICVYMPIRNGNTNRLFQHIRGRFGAHLMPSTQLARAIIPWRKKQYIIGLVSDQSPGNPASAYWMQFLNRPTCFVSGPERNAQVLGQHLVYCRITRPTRGHYHFEFELLNISSEMAETPGAVTRLLARKTEQDIRENPDNYLWSHRRWKHAWKPEYAPQWIDEPVAIPV